MKLTLDHTQRLNIDFLIGQQRGCTIDDLRLCWRIQDQVRLNPEELKAINYRREQQNGNVAVLWDSDKSLPPMECELPDEAGARITKAITEWPHGYSTDTRGWLEPLLRQLKQYEHTTTNDHKDPGVRTA